MSSSLSPLIDLLSALSPNSRVSITLSSSSSKRYKRTTPRAGDRRFIKRRGGWCVRQQVMSYNRDGSVIGANVRNGKPVWEWVLEDGMTTMEVQLWKRVRINRGEKE